tara:strand:- start:2605 stop:3897 length:1293 start_codon:yes stop_codon:yes gene_type:complete
MNNTPRSFMMSFEGRSGAWIIGLLSFFAMMPVVGFPIGRLSISLLVFVVPFYLAWAFRYNYIEKKYVGILILVCSWFAMTSMVNGHSVGSFLQSLIAFVLCVSVFAVKPSAHVLLRPAVGGFLCGLVVAFGVGFLDLLGSLTSLPQPHEYIPLPNWSIGGTYEVSGINRVRSLCNEPSGFARQMVFAFAILSFLRPTSRKAAMIVYLFQITCICFLVLTFSLTGIILFAAFVIARYWRVLFSVKSGLKSIISIAMGVTLIAAVFFFKKDLSIQDIVATYTERVERGIRDVQAGVISSSTGMRLQSIIIPFEYIKDTGIKGLSIGEGYANQEMWLYMNYAYDARSGMSSGSIYNLFSVVFISTGIIGLILYSFLILRMPMGVVGFRLPLMALFVLFHFSTGLLLYFDMWILLYAMYAYASVYHLRTSPSLR